MDHSCASPGLLSGLDASLTWRYRCRDYEWSHQSYIELATSGFAGTLTAICRITHPRFNIAPEQISPTIPVIFPRRRRQSSFCALGPHEKMMTTRMSHGLHRAVLAAVLLYVAGVLLSIRYAQVITNITSSGLRTAVNGSTQRTVCWWNM